MAKQQQQEQAPAPPKKTPAEKEQSIITALAKYQKQIEKVVPRYITPDRMLRLVTGEINRTPLLKACSVMSIINGVTTAASLGIGIGPRSAYLVPFLTTKKINGGLVRGYEATLMIDYRSKITLAKRCGVIIRPPQLVFPGDEFQAQYENGALVIHHVRGLKGQRVERYEFKDPKEKGKGGFTLTPNYTHAYVFWRDGDEILGEMMDADQLDAVRRRSKAGNDGPWITDAGQMARKTVVHRAFNYIAFDPETSVGRQALRSQEIDVAFEAGESLPLQIEPQSPGDIDAVVDASFVPVDEQERSMPQRNSEQRQREPGEDEDAMTEDEMRANDPE